VVVGPGQVLGNIVIGANSRWTNAVVVKPSPDFRRGRVPGQWCAAIPARYPVKPEHNGLPDPGCASCQPVGNNSHRLSKGPMFANWYCLRSLLLYGWVALESGGPAKLAQKILCKTALAKSRNDQYYLRQELVLPK
jgi:hypothetical protein